MASSRLDFYIYVPPDASETTRMNGILRTYSIRNKYIYYPGRLQKYRSLDSSTAMLLGIEVNRVRANGEGMGCTQREPTALFICSEGLMRDNSCPDFAELGPIIIILLLEFQVHQVLRERCARIVRLNHHLYNSRRDRFQGI